MSVIFKDDPEALSKLSVKLEGLETEKKYWKGLKQEKRTYQIETDSMKRCYMLPNLNANIRSVKLKIAEIENLQKNNISLVRKTTFKNGRKVFFYEENQN